MKTVLTIAGSDSTAAQEYKPTSKQFPQTAAMR